MSTDNRKIHKAFYGSMRALIFPFSPTLRAAVCRLPAPFVDSKKARPPFNEVRGPCIIKGSDPLMIQNKAPGWHWDSSLTSRVLSVLFMCYPRTGRICTAFNYSASTGRTEKPLWLARPFTLWPYTSYLSNPNPRIHAQLSLS